MSGSSGSSGGGSSGAVSYPSYMQNMHSKWLTEWDLNYKDVYIIDNPYVDVEAYSPEAMATVLDTQIGNYYTYLAASLGAGTPSSMWASFLTIVEPYLDALYDPSTDYATALAAITALSNAVSAIDVPGDYEDAIDTAKAKIDALISTTEIASDVSAYSEILNDEVNYKVLPQFQAGLRDINAVVSSSFVVGESVIWAFKERDVAKYTADLQLQNYRQRNEMIIESVKIIVQNLYRDLELTSKVAELNMDFVKAKSFTDLATVKNAMEATGQVLSFANQTVDSYKNYFHYKAEVERMKYVARKEKNEQDVVYDEQEAKWPLEAYQYGANLLAGIGGGVMSPGEASMGKTSKGASALSGALTGAAMGAQLGAGHPLAIGAGAVIGGIAGLLMS